LWVVDSNNYRIQKITLGSDGAMSDFEYIAGIGTTPGWGGTGTNVTQNFLSPSGLVVSADELNIYIADTANHVIRRLQRTDKTSVVWNAVTLAGAVGLKGNVNGRGTEARLSFPTGLALDETNGFLYFTEFGNHGVRRLILPGANSAQPYVQGGTL
jgi:sugar lactone lactonase YvrE